MTDGNPTEGEHEDTRPEAERTVSQQAKQKPADKPGKPDEGTRPENLTSENDGGAEG